MIDLTNEEDYSILKLDLNRLDAIINRLIEEHENGNVRIDIDDFRVGIGFESDIIDKFLDEFQLNGDSFEKITSDILFFIVMLAVNEEEAILKKYGNERKIKKILELFGKQLQKYPSLKRNLHFESTCRMQCFKYKRGSIVAYETSRVSSICSRKDYVSEMRDSLLETVGEIRDNFEDFRDRQMWFFKLKKALESARKESQENPVLLELVVCLFDTVKNLYSENLTAEHIATLETIIYYIKSGITEADVDEATEKLISAGLSPLPKLDGLVEIYKRQGEI